jgi:hypothetical protein
MKKLNIKIKNQMDFRYGTKAPFNKLTFTELPKFRPYNLRRANKPNYFKKFLTFEISKGPEHSIDLTAERKTTRTVHLDVGVLKVCQVAKGGEHADPAQDARETVSQGHDHHVAAHVTDALVLFAQSSKSIYLSYTVLYSHK